MGTAKNSGKTNEEMVQETKDKKTTKKNIGCCD
jgi:hypothetical protein